MRSQNLFILTLSISLFSSAAAWAVCGSNKIVIDTSDNTSCLEKNAPQVCETLRRLTNKFGELKIVSGFRGKKANQNRGGAKYSKHLQCRAADIVLQYVGHTGETGYAMAEGFKGKRKEVNDFLKTLPTRYNVYPTGRIHVDNTSTSEGLPDNYDSPFAKTYRKRNYNDYNESTEAPGSEELDQQIAELKKTAAPLEGDSGGSDSVDIAGLESDGNSTSAAESPDLADDPAPAPRKSYKRSPASSSGGYTRRAPKSYQQTRYYQKRYYNETVNDIMRRALGQP